MSSTKEEAIFVTIMLEVIGRPKEHLKEVLQDLIKKIGQEKGIKIKHSEVYEPTELKDNKSLYTSFAEMDIEADSMREIMQITFKYMPSHIEVVSPENLTLNNNFLNDIFNELTRRLHAYDQIVRIVQNEKIILEKQLKELSEKKKKSSK